MSGVSGGGVAGRDEGEYRVNDEIEELGGWLVPAMPVCRYAMVCPHRWDDSSSVDDSSACHTMFPWAPRATLPERRVSTAWCGGGGSVRLGIHSSLLQVSVRVMVPEVAGKANRNCCGDGAPPVGSVSETGSRSPRPPCASVRRVLRAPCMRCSSQPSVLSYSPRREVWEGMKEG